MYCKAIQVFIITFCLALGGCYTEKEVPESVTSQPTDSYTEADKGAKDHAELFAKTSYPSASQCAPCHEQIYDEWRSSNHAYSAISPMFHKFEQTLQVLASGTVNNFCVRCHMSVGTIFDDGKNPNEDRATPLWKRSQISREGVTCITCHRVNEEYGRVNGNRRIVPGDIHQAMYGTRGGKALDEVVKDKDVYKVATNDTETGPKIHLKGIKFEPMSTSEFCVSCHQVAVHPQIKLEVVWEQYRDSPAHRQGITCQDCHMGKIPGVPAGYAKGPVAVVNGKAIRPNGKHPNHAFYGPGYPIAHPGIFPHNKNAEKYDMQAWLKFDYRAGWGTEEFENKVDSGALKVNFPEEWAEVDDRYEAREIITDNIKQLEYKRKMREQVMENGSRIDGPFFSGKPRAGQSLKFRYKITNTDSGHNMPSGSLGAQPEIWFNVALIDPDGVNIWETGYVDKHGDMCDLHSLEVRAGIIPHDNQLFNLQTKFLTTNVKGTDREMYLPVNFDFDQRPFIRPGNTPNSVMNHPPFIRMEGRSIPPLSWRYANYSVPASLMKKPGTYRLASRMRSRAEPIYFMKLCGSTLEMEQAMNEWMIDIHPYTVEFDVE
jgi:hypothetical protein